jgi:uncharacterized protein (TIGR03086 family)
VSECRDRYCKVAGGFTDRVRLVPASAWDNPTPCEGWVARDVVRHLVEWVPGFFAGYWDRALTVEPSVDDDPAAAWGALDRALVAALDDPALASSVREAPMGTMTFEEALDMVVTPDVLVHTWDLARSTGLDDRLDPVEVHRMFDGIEPMDEMLRSSGHYGPRVMVPGDADELTQLIGFLGRDPAFAPPR